MTAVDKLRIIARDSGCFYHSKMGTDGYYQVCLCDSNNCVIIQMGFYLLRAFADTAELAASALLERLEK